MHVSSVLCALGGELEVKGPDGEQAILVLSLFKNYLLIALGPQAEVAEVQVPKLGSKSRWSYKEFTRRVGTLDRRLVAGGGSG